MVSGPAVYICDACVGFCVDELRSHGIEPGTHIDITPKEEPCPQKS